MTKKKPEPMIMLAIRIPAGDVKRLRRVAKMRGMTLSELARHLLSVMPPFPVPGYPAGYPANS